MIVRTTSVDGLHPVLEKITERQAVEEIKNLSDGNTFDPQRARDSLQSGGSITISFPVPDEERKPNVIGPQYCTVSYEKEGIGRLVVPLF